MKLKAYCPGCKRLVGNVNLFVNFSTIETVQKYIYFIDCQECESTMMCVEEAK